MTPLVHKGLVMPKINVYLPDDLAEAVKEAGVPVSAICQRALEQAVRRVTAIRETAVSDLQADDLTTRLPNFTARARAVITLGVQRARADGAPSVGTEHLLGGLIAEGGNLALHVLRAVEIEPAQVARDLARQASAQPGSEEGTPARFSSPAANALELTVTEATALGHNYIGCEHLLLGLIAEPEGAAGQVLRTLGAEPRLTRRAVVAALAGYVHLRAQGGTETPAVPADAAKALATAVRQELQPLLRRIERLEEHVGVTTESR
jgi:ATP-dependent Clp protease ATP-binding subunit ClpA